MIKYVTKHCAARRIVRFCRQRSSQLASSGGLRGGDSDSNFDARVDFLESRGHHVHVDYYYTDRNGATRLVVRLNECRENIPWWTFAQVGAPARVLNDASAGKAKEP